MGTIKYAIVLCLMLLVQLVTCAQPTGSSMSNPINLGILNNCSGPPATITANNNPANGYGNNYGQASHDVWYKFTLSAASQVHLSLCGSDFDTYLYLLNSSGGLLQSNDDNGPLCSGTKSSLISDLTAGTYYIVAEGYSSYYGNIRGDVNAYPSTGPKFGSVPAQAVNIGIPVEGVRYPYLYFTNECFKSNYNGQPSNDVWFKFSLNVPQKVRINTCSSDFDTYISLLKDDLSLIAFNDDRQDGEEGCPLNTSYLELTLPAGNYYIVAEGFMYSEGRLMLSFTVPWTLPFDGCPLLAAKPSQDQNYISTYTPRIAGVNRQELLKEGSVCQINQEVQYFDGLGRPLQAVQIKAVPNKDQDLIQPVAYDKFGREPTKYLPYATATGRAGSYRPDALNGSNGYSNSAQKIFYSQTGISYKDMASPYAVTVFEASPLNKVLEQGAPGDAWQPVAGSTAGHTVKVDYGANVTDEVRLWSATSIGASTSEAYLAAKLYKTISKDENWVSGKAGTVEEFKDLEGRIVLKRIWESESTSLSTYYVYDDFGNLRYVLPPAVGVNSFLETDPVFLNFIYGYHYDARKRLIEKKIPGKGWEYMVYNKLDQLVASQDAVQRAKAPQEWLYSKYDGLGRVVQNGIYTYPASTAGTSYRIALQTTVNAQTQAWETRASGADYTNLAFPVSGMNLQAVNYYDDYTFPEGNTYTFIGASLKTKGLLTGNKIQVLGTSNMLLGLMYYDEEGRAVKSFKQHYLGGTVSASNYDEISNSYSFTNELTASTRIHHVGAAATTIATTYTYDHMGRKLGTKESINGAADITLSKLEYNEIGQLKKKSLHSTDGTNFLQSAGYTYNERGWLKSNTAGLFGFELKYQDGSTPQYNGNISNQNWGANGVNPNVYTYSYDKLNRLLNGASTGVAMSEVLSYDVMGNIKSLSRDGVASLYSYIAGNRLPGNRWYCNWNLSV